MSFVNMALTERLKSLRKVKSRTERSKILYNTATKKLNGATGLFYRRKGIIQTLASEMIDYMLDDETEMVNTFYTIIRDALVEEDLANRVEEDWSLINGPTILVTEQTYGSLRKDQNIDDKYADIFLELHGLGLRFAASYVKIAPETYRSIISL